MNLYLAQEHIAMLKACIVRLQKCIIACQDMMSRCGIEENVEYVGEAHVANPLDCAGQLAELEKSCVESIQHCQDTIIICADLIKNCDDTVCIIALENIIKECRDCIMACQECINSCLSDSAKCADVSIFCIEACKKTIHVMAMTLELAT